MDPIFIEAQLFNTEKRVLFQDNLGVMLLERNVVASSSRCTKHIRVRYYFIKDHMFMRYIVLKHYPIGEVYADHFTKLLQGALFQKIRSEIQGILVTTKNEEMCWAAPGLFNMEPGTTNTETSKPITQDCVGE